MKKRHIALGIGGAIGAAIAVKMLTRPKTVDWDDVSGDVPHSEHSHFIAVDGARVHYQEFGEAADPTLLLIHGYTASVTSWRTSAPMLAARGFRVIAIDLLGFGYSEKPPWFEYSITAQARVVARFMNRLGIGRATIVGSSYGGAVAATLALDYPERVEKLVLVSAVSDDGPKNLPILRLSALPGIGEALTPFLAGSRAFWRFRMRNTLAPANHHLIDDTRVANVVRPLHAADAHHSLLATSRNWSAERVGRDAQYINQPTLIIWGEDDRVVPIAGGHRLHDAILNSRFVVLRDCGHMPAEEKAELFTDLVTEFCRDRKGRLAAKDDDKMRLEA
ncbi:MAG: alpha/beta fold hydrolase [Pyrinomonadaceae bacterium]